jgi:glutamyl-tRNA reductase
VDFVVVGISHKTAPVEVREQAVVPEPALGACIQRLVDRDLIESGVLLSTCNRTELYALAPTGDGGDRLLEAFGQWPHELDYETWRRYAYRLSDDEALTHLFRVAAGLESMVVGEAQILGQVKDALARAREAGAVNARLQVILQGAIRAGKRVRAETSIGRRPVSVAHAAVAIEPVDIVISASSAPTYLFDRALVARLQARRSGRPLLVIDLAVPRDVDPAASELAGVRLLNIDDLRSIAAGNLAERGSATEPAERIIEEELTRTRRALHAREAAPAIRKLVQHVNALRDEELNRHLARVPVEEAAGREAMRALAGSLTRKILDAQVRTLRDEPSQP